MLDTYNFPDNEHGREMRANLARGLRECGREVEETEEIIQVKILKLIVGKRIDEGRISANMKKCAKTTRQLISER